MYIYISLRESEIAAKAVSLTTLYWLHYHLIIFTSPIITITSKGLFFFLFKTDRTKYIPLCTYICI